ncbi:MAG TPA: DUF892 family protein [Clostridia bacterium]|nr:DUF892 family protein [Clostridia bacterium]
MQTAHELFLHELSDMLDAERKFLEITGEFAEEVSRPDMKKQFETHRAQTEKQIERLEQCFEELSEEPEEAECAGVKGLVEEHQNFKEEDPSDDILNVFDITASIKGERYEISAYESLIRMGTMMDHKKVVRLLGQSLKEEQQMAKKMETFANKVKPEKLGMEEEEGEGVSEETMDEMGMEGEEMTDTGAARGRKSQKTAGRSRSQGRRAA